MTMQLAKIVSAFTHNGQVFSINEVGSFSDTHAQELIARGAIDVDKQTLAYALARNTPIKTAVYETIIDVPPEPPIFAERPWRIPRE